jgi:glycosyltransferase involved in cell wall biosynthesis
MPRISVIIPTYNSAQYIREAIDSVLSQTYRDYEIIVVDDGSKDNTAEVLREYGDKILYLYQENAGTNPARSRGLKEAKGEYIALIDADDKWLPDKLQEQVEFMDVSPEINLLFSDFYNFNENGTFEQTFFNNNKAFRKIRTKSISGNRPHWKLFDQSFLYEYLVGNFILQSTLMVRRDICIRFNMFQDNDFSLRDMYEFLLRSLHQLKIGFIDKVLVHRRIHDSNLTLNAEKYYENTIAICQKAKNYPWMDQRCQRFLKRELKNTYFRLGKYYSFRGNFVEARNVLRRSIKKHFHPFSIVLLFLTYLSSVRIIFLAGRIKNLITTMVKINGNSDN